MFRCSGLPDFEGAGSVYEEEVVEEIAL